MESNEIPTNHFTVSQIFILKHVVGNDINEIWELDEHDNVEKSYTCIKKKVGRGEWGF